MQIDAKDRRARFVNRVNRVRGLLNEEVPRIVLEDPANIAWLTSGGRSYVERGRAGVAAVEIDGRSLTVHTSVNEFPRLRDEEFADLQVSWNVSPWTVDFRTALRREMPAGWDTGEHAEGGTQLDIAHLHTGLLEAEICSLSRTGADLARILTDAVLEARRDMTESELCREISARLGSEGMTPVVALVAGAERITRHRHPLPTDSPIGGRGLVGVCAERDGLIASASRLFCFGVVPNELSDAYARLLGVEAGFLRHSRAGNTVGDVFRAGIDGYRMNGFDQHEYRNHHQGGRTGYFSRYSLATEVSTDLIQEREAFAWNPTAPGLKVEDTFVVGADGPEFLTVDARWPTITVDGRPRPDIAVVEQSGSRQ